jgi:hypothetical protein
MHFSSKYVVVFAYSVYAVLTTAMWCAEIKIIIQAQWQNYLQQLHLHVKLLQQLTVIYYSCLCWIFLLPSYGQCCLVWMNCAPITICSAKHWRQNHYLVHNTKSSLRWLCRRKHCCNPTGSLFTQPVEVGGVQIEASAHQEGIAFCNNLMAKKFVVSILVTVITIYLSLFSSSCYWKGFVQMVMKTQIHTRKKWK